MRINNWQFADIQCLPAHWHNTPDRITPGVEQKILANCTKYNRILVAYGDCGTGGQLDAMLERYGVERLPGAHCYSFFSGQQKFEQLASDEIGTFYLTDYLAAHFDRIILKELGIAKYPELRDMYFAHYTRVLYLAQTKNTNILDCAKSAAAALSLPFEVQYTGLEPIHHSLDKIRIAAA